MSHFLRKRTAGAPSSRQAPAGGKWESRSGLIAGASLALGLVGASVAVLFGTGVLGTGNPSKPASKTTSALTSTLRQRTTSVTRDGVTVSLTFNRLKVPSGTTVHGYLSIDNRTSHQLRAGEVCPSQAFLVAIESKKISPNLAFSTVGCIHPFTFPIGASTWKVAADTRYAWRGSSYLPPGRYAFVLVFDGFRLPIPPPVTVILTKKQGQPEPPPRTTPPTVPPVTAVPPTVPLTVPPATAPRVRS